MKELVVKLLTEQNNALKASEIADILNVIEVEQFKNLLDVLKELEDELVVYKSNKEKYMLFQDSHLKKGTLSVNSKGFGFILIKDEEDDIYISPNNMNGAINNDLVIVELTSKKGAEKPEGRILRVVERDLGKLVGEYTWSYKKKQGFVNLDDKKIKLNILIEHGKENGAMNGHKVIVKLTKQTKNDEYLAEVEKIIGHKEDPGVDILSLVYKHGIDDKFSEEVMDEARNMPEEVTEKDTFDRIDMRDKMIYTIDGADAKDLDDAIRVEKLENGNYLLGVYIADVSYYVKEDSEIDKTAQDRATSVYLVDRVIPMLPHILSNGICSLNGNVDRLAMACDMEIDGNGKVVDYQIYQTVINSKKRMTYSAVNSILEDNTTPEGYEDFADNIHLAYKLATVLRKQKVSRGYIEFETDEAKITVDDKGKPVEIGKRYRGEGQKLIEDFMIAANETVASHIFHMELPFVYRIHEKPKEERINSFMSFVSALGYTVTGKKNSNHSKGIQNILNQLHDAEEYPIFADLLLRSMQKAVYSPENVGHFGLGSKCYCHFTSPIRRYPDTTVHRLLRTYLVENKMDKGTVSKWKDKVVMISEHSSLKERSAVGCERDVDDMKMAEYMMDHIGEEFEGMISGVMNFGMFVKLDNLIEGLVHVTEMDDYYTYNEINMSLIGEKKNKSYRIGDKVKIKVIAASKELGKIDFALFSEKDENKKEKQNKNK